MMEIVSRKRMQLGRPKLCTTMKDGQMIVTIYSNTTVAELLLDEKDIGVLEQTIAAYRQLER